MTISIHIHLTHRQHTEGKKTIETDGKTVGRALQNLTKKYPGMIKVLYDKKGDLRNYIEIYLNGKSAYPGELEKRITHGDEIQIITFLAGG